MFEQQVQVHDATLDEALQHLLRQMGCDHGAQATIRQGWQGCAGMGQGIQILLCEAGRQSLGHYYCYSYYCNTVIV